MQTPLDDDKLARIKQALSSLELPLPGAVVLEWSQSRRTFQISDWAELATRNRRRYLAGIRSDFIPLGIFKKQADADRFADGLRDIAEGTTAQSE